MVTPSHSQTSSMTTESLRFIANGGLDSPKSTITTLTNAFEAEDYSTCLTNLKPAGIEPQSFIEGLDKAIAMLSLGSDIRDRCVRELSRACEIYGLLPSSYRVKSTLKKSENPIATGGFFDIWKATNEGKEEFAVKAFRVYQSVSMQVKKKYCGRVVRSMWMDHPNILRIEGIAPDLFPCCMVAKMMDNGNMLEYLNQHQGHIDRLELLRGVIRGLDYLHAHGDVHGDLKSYNIFINKQGNPCLAGFGLSSIARDTYSVRGSNASGGLPARWSAPELMRDAWVMPTTQSDVYSLGMVVVEAFTGRVPFPNATEACVAMTISTGGRPQKPTNCENLGLGTALWELTEDCWRQDREKRPDISVVLRRFQAILVAGKGKRSLPWIEKLKFIGKSFDQAQQRINRLDQDLERGIAPNNERQGKLDDLCKLCSTHKLIPDSMKLQGYRNDSVEEKEYKGPTSVHQSKFKGRMVAIKITRLYIPQEFEDPLWVASFCREAVLWKHLHHHPNILPLVGATISKNRLCFISEWMDQGNIIQYLGLKENLEVNRIELLIDVVDGLSHIHNLNTPVVHGNLKGANIFIKNFRACIAGFSLSTIARAGQWGGTTDTLPSCTPGGSLRWMSPELLDPRRLNENEPRPTTASDRFSLGMVIYEVLCGHVPYDGLETETINHAILDGTRPYKPAAAAELGLVDELWELLQRCWNADPELRPGLRTIRARLGEVTPLWQVRAGLPSRPDVPT